MKQETSIDERMVDTDPPAASPARSRPWLWLSTGLILVGLLLLGAGGLMAYLNSATLADPPPPVGVVEPPPLLSLEENPLPALADTPSSFALEENPLPALADTSSSVGLVTPTFPPGLEENPLPVIVNGEPPGARGDLRSPPTLTLASDALESDTAEAGESPDPVAMREAEAEVPSSLPANRVLRPVLAAKNPPTRIVAPVINLDAEVVPVGWKQITQEGKNVSVWEVAEYAAGWHQNSSLPGGGGNVVLSGHHNVKGEVFRYIVDLNPGDTVTLYADERPYTYTVESRFVVRDKGVPEEKRRGNARWVGSFSDERVTLVTCWPYTNNTHRVIVIAKPTE